jgi:hypothetical protein
MLAQMIRRQAGFRASAEVNGQSSASRVTSAERISAGSPDIRKVRRRQDRQEPSLALRAARGSVLIGDQIRRVGGLAGHAGPSPRCFLVVLEDLHWGDLPTVKVLDATLGTSPSLLMVLAFAAGFTASSLASGSRGVQRSTSGSAEAAKLVREVLGDRAAPDVVARVVGAPRKARSISRADSPRRAADGRHARRFSR